MRTMVVDDEPIMLKGFARQSAGIEQLNIIGMFSIPEEALEFAEKEEIDLAILDIALPRISGIELASKLQAMHPGILIVFITAYDNFIRDANGINADYYIVKPYTREMLVKMVERMSLISRRQRKAVYVRMFGVFTVYKDGQPIPLTGKAKEILALVATRRGKEISNKEIYFTIWEEREYSNTRMKVYYNALSRLKMTLEDVGLSELLHSTQRGQIFNAEMVDCDYYAWLDGDAQENERFDGEMLTEYSWGEYLLAELLENEAGEADTLKSLEK